ncbi:hypothetical protein [Brevibacterium oceani]|uniref:hypothetical protein n=1 Tax=Brevibacterium oceani TaxID=358099 RepID=UPI001B33D6D0|nr:hypothetical protein [Brevibacterium oceani]
MSDSVPTPRPEEPIPSWSYDFWRVFGLKAFAVVFFSLTVLLSHFGLLRKNVFSDPIEADALWLGICVGLIAVLYPFLLMNTSSADFGYRRQGLVRLLVFGIPLAAVMEVLIMMTWPFMLGDRAVPGTVAADLAADPSSMVLVFLYIIGSTTWMLVVIMGLAFAPIWLKIVLLPVYIGAIFAVEFLGIRIFENSASGGLIIVWAAVAVCGLAAVGAFAALRSVLDPAPRQMTEGERMELSRRQRVEFDWHSGNDHFRNGAQGWS